MRGKLATVAVLTVAVAACTSDGTPATTPTTIPVTAATVATSLPPETTFTTTTGPTTTTLARLSEIEAIFQDLEERRLQALYEGDREAFRSLFANPEYRERSMGAFDVVDFVDDWEAPQVEVAEVLADEGTCIAVRTTTDFTGVFAGSEPRDMIEVVEKAGDNWGLSYAGEGWECDGTHPFSP